MYSTNELKIIEREPVERAIRVLTEPSPSNDSALKDRGAISMPVQ